jgi:hypothetical protein
MQKRLVLATTASLLVGTGGTVAAVEPLASPDAGASPVVCPNTWGGACRGPLEAGAYRSTTFLIPFTFSVPEGWGDFEDFPDSILLLPPGSDLDGVDAGTSDAIMIKQGVVVANGACEERPEAGVGTSAEAVAAELAGRDGLVVSDPLPVEVGGLSGLMIDIAYDVEAGAGCRYEGYPVTLVPLIMDIDPGGFIHTQSEGFTTRLYLLDLGGANIVIEVQDAPYPSGTPDDYATVIDSIEFSTTASG